MKRLPDTFDLDKAQPGTIIRSVYLRGVGLIYLAAFASMSVQIHGLIGSHGILPITEHLDNIAYWYESQKYWHLPLLFWLNADDAALTAVCYLGMVVSALVIFDFLTLPALIACYVLYLSIANAGQDFTGFQWDVFLLESGVLAILMVWNSRFSRFLGRLLIARFMFMSGVVKIASGDAAWLNLSALDFHYLTQPLPSPLAYHAYFLPEIWHKFCTAAVLFIELVAPFGVFLSRRFRLFAAFCFILLQVSIILTGNYTFFNLLTLLLCVFLFEDRDLARILPKSWLKKLLCRSNEPSRLADICALSWTAFVITALTIHLWMAQTKSTPPTLMRTLLDTASNFALVNNYGPFAVMTTERNEIIIEGSNDSEHWLEYGFRYKPDALDKPLSWNIPHQPRLDWQMWFAALAPPQAGGWFEKFMHRLQDGTPEVLALMAHNPFPGTPPRQLRAVVYRYTFATPEERTRTGQIWRREFRGHYYPMPL